MEWQGPQWKVRRLWFRRGFEVVYHNSDLRWIRCATFKKECDAKLFAFVRGEYYGGTSFGLALSAHMRPRAT